MSHSSNTITRLLRGFFGIFMVVVYLGMAYLLAMNYFDWDATPFWKAVRWGMATIFGIYGIYRGYRQIKGIDYYRNNE